MPGLVIFSQKGRKVFCIENDSSKPVPVVSRVIQESILGPTLFTFFLDSLLRKLPVPSYTFADDLKIVFEVNDNNRELNQSAVLHIEEWSIENKMLLSIKKCCVLRGGKNNPGHKYFLFGQYINSCDAMSNLGIIRSVNCNYR